jgi:hypothetical protein
MSVKPSLKAHGVNAYVLLSLNKLYWLCVNNASERALMVSVFAVRIVSDTWLKADIKQPVVVFCKNIKNYFIKTFNARLDVALCEQLSEKLTVSMNYTTGC